MNHKKDGANRDDQKYSGIGKREMERTKEGGERDIVTQRGYINEQKEKDPTPNSLAGEHSI